MIEMDREILKGLTILMIIILIASSLTVLTPVSTASEPDYSYEMELPDDGSNDTGEVYSITRRNSSLDGYISIEAYVDEAEIYVELENVEKVTLYFNETDVDLEKYVGIIPASIDIIITSDGEELDGEFHGVPDPDNVDVSTAWIDYTYEDDVFSWEGLETSTTTITLSWDGFVDTIINIIVFVWMMSFLIFILKLVSGTMTKLVRETT